MSGLSVFHHLMSRSPFTTTPPRWRMQKKLDGGGYIRSLMVEETRPAVVAVAVVRRGKARHGGWRRQGEAGMAAFFI
ncbi:hypothetical protein F2Q69_00007230 [Brassica cretica]|uniref:Uncharacterized protein n=3 Tax=Brassica TaxID=3705 RepID=A0A8S9PHK7_BRACR|nr:hypothetical protein F2Q69_00007230 [Brassica cretica]